MFASTSQDGLHRGLTPIWNLKLTISTWNARRWPRLQKANQVRVMGLFGFSFNEAGEVVQ